jgi:hypothetical protein
MKVRLWFGCIAGAALLATLPVYAHHSSAPHYDASKEIELDGVVTKWAFVNPHAYVYFDVVNDSGEVVNWRCESNAATSLGRRGWDAETFLPGQKLRINGAPARREDNVCSLNSVTFADGRTVGRSDTLTEAPPPVVVDEKFSDMPARAAYLANGQPNLAGPWVSPPRSGPPGRGMGEGAQPGGSRGPGGPRSTQMTEAGKAAAEQYDIRFDDPSLKCHPANIIFAWTHDQHVNDIYQEDNKVILQNGYVDFVRNIHLDQTDHPNSLTPGVGGHSIGWWEDDTLVVDTIGFEAGILFPLTPLMHSEQMHVIERFTVDNDALTLTRSYVATDPLYLAEEYVGENVMNISAKPYEPYNCVELSGKNNLRPESEIR